ncbi:MULTISPECIES: class I SAM-dependent methyltransferase [unclassified Mesorhizobium]|uniref:class I SAM-dependent methyltransferase n=1 Tax=unclassified Mesorhizobium TaxID=325217 RepID=UPI00333921C4
MLKSDDADYRYRVKGISYHQFLSGLHSKLKPRTYLEIGTLRGRTLRSADCASIAIDPKFRVSSRVMGRKPSCLFFQMTSDDFFARYDPRALFGAPVDLAFIDGMHLLEYVLRDLINTEKNSERNSVIALHDCAPPGFYMTARSMSDPLFKKSRYANAWTGDVWKIVPILKKFRPKLNVVVTDCKPTGLVLITNLDPSNTALESSYDDIVSRYAISTMDRTEYEAYWASLNVLTSHSWTKSTMI